MKKIARSLPLLGVIVLSMGAAFLDHQEGDPYRWSTTATINYRVDIDADIDGITNARMKELIQVAFNTWEASTIVSDNLDFEIDGTNPDLSENVTGTNYDDYVKLNADGSFSNVAPNNSGVYILLDEDGGILRGLLEDPLGSSTDDILGIASAGKFNQATKKIEAGFAIINGAAGVTEESVAYTMTHELGHLMNLAHTQLNHEEAFDDDVPNDAQVPLMFPYITDKTITLPTVPATDVYPGLLEWDDEFSLAYLYPNQTTFNAKGFLEGKIRRRTGEYVRGVNVMCRKVGDLRESAVSWISDQELDGRGEFTCGNLSTGDYEVSIEPIDLAINLFDPDPPFIATEFYSGTSESHDPDVDSRTSKTAVAVTEGDTTSDVDIVLNEDGRLTSGVAKEGTIEGGYPDLEYFITVPPQATGLKVELTTQDDVDLDVYARCDDEFSLTAGITSDPIYVPSGGAQQAEHAAASNANSETLTITSSSSPKLKGCTYHILVNDFFEASAMNPASFEIKATILGTTPKLTAKKSTIDFVSLSGSEVLIASQLLKASGDTFNVTALIFEDIGIDPMDDVVAAKLYEDVNDDGKLSSADEFLVEASAINANARTVRFEGLDQYVSPSAGKRFFVTYELSSEARLPWIACLFMLGLFVPLAFGRRMGVAATLLLLLTFLSCAEKGGTERYEPQLNKSESIEATGLGFGSEVTVDIDVTPDSVLDFFD